MNTALRPMSTGQVLDRTFNLYRQHFMLFFGIALIPQAFALVIQLAPLGIQQTGAELAVTAAIAGLVGMFFFIIAWVVGYAVAQAATVFALSAVHLGRATSISDSYGRVRGRYGRVLNVVLSVGIRVVGGGLVVMLAGGALIASPRTLGLSSGGAGVLVATGVLLMIAGMIVALLLLLRYAVAVPACVLEDIKARDALKRSVHLTKGNRGRIFVIYFLVGILNYIVMFALLIPAAMLGAAIAGEQSVVAQALNALAGVLAGALIAPVATIAMALVYYDERVRKEAFDLQLMMGALDKPTGAAASAASY